MPSAPRRLASAKASRVFSTNPSVWPRWAKTALTSGVIPTRHPFLPPVRKIKPACQYRSELLPSSRQSLLSDGYRSGSYHVKRITTAGGGSPALMEPDGRFGMQTTGVVSQHVGTPNLIYFFPSARLAPPSTRSMRPKACAVPAKRSSPAWSSPWPPTRSPAAWGAPGRGVLKLRSGVAGRPSLPVLLWTGRTG